MAHLTGSESQLLSVAVGAALTLAGGAATHWRQAKTARTEARDRAIQETRAAADDLLAGVRLFRQVRGASVMIRGIGSGIKVTAARVDTLDKDQEITLKQKIALGLLDLMLAVAPGGIMEQAADKDSTYFQGMVVPARERLTAAVSSFRVGPDRHLAEAADRLVRAGGELADGASSLRPGKFKRLERAFEARVREFQRATRKG